MVEGVTMKIVINRCYGGFGLSHKAIMEYGKRMGMDLSAWQKGASYTDHVPYDGTSDVLFVSYYKGDTPIDSQYFSSREIKREDPVLVAIVEELGSEYASGRLSELQVIEIPDGVEWHIEEYDGIEHVAEDHRTWGD